MFVDLNSSFELENKIITDKKRTTEDMESTELKKKY